MTPREIAWYQEGDAARRRQSHYLLTDAIGSHVATIASMLLGDKVDPERVRLSVVPSALDREFRPAPVVHHKGRGALWRARGEVSDGVGSKPMGASGT